MKYLFLLFSIVYVQAFASYYIPDSGVTTAKIKDANVTRAKLATGAMPKVLYVTAAGDTSLSTSTTDILEMTCSAACTVTLPTAVGIQGYQVTIIHNGTQLVPITLHTTSSQTVGGIADNVYILNTIAERLTIYSDNSNWKIKSHQTDNNSWTDASPLIKFVTYTVTSASATLAATYVQAYVFTITAGSTASVGAIYSNNGNNYTLVKALLVGDTSVTVTGVANPLASGTLTYVSGTHTGGNLTFSAFAGGPNTHICTVAQTIASQVTLITSCPSLNTTSGILAKTGGTGDALITYSSFTGAANTLLATTTAPIFFGVPINNSYKWKRVNGNTVRLWINWYQTTAGPVAGSGDWLFPVPSGMTIDSNVFAYYTGGTAQTQYASTSAQTSNWWPGFVGGWGSNSNTYGIQPGPVVPYDSTHYRIFSVVQGNANGQALGNAYFGGATGVEAFQIQFDLPIFGWQP